MGEEIKQRSNDWRPLSISSGDLPQLRTDHPELQAIDETEINLKELFLLRHPVYRFEKNYQEALKKFLALYHHPGFGQWFYFPWLNTVTRYLPEDLHLELRTGRNKNLITATEQARFYYSAATFLGMSVGSHAAVVTAMIGGSRRMKLVDFDTFSGDNLNRVRFGFQHVGLNKAVAVAREIVTINPYAVLEVYTGGLTESNAKQILSGSDVVVEEMDDPYWKLRARELAKMRKIPVLMGTDNGDGAIVDVERYDLDPNRPILNGLIGDLAAASLKSMPPENLPRTAGQIAGANLTVPRMLFSVAEVGKSLYSWPQLGTAANLCGSVLAYLARRIVVGDKNIKSGRYSVNLDAIFESDYRWRFFQRKVALLKFVKLMNHKRGNDKPAND